MQILPTKRNLSAAEALAVFCCLHDVHLTFHCICSTPTNFILSKILKFQLKFRICNENFKFFRQNRVAGILRAFSLVSNFIRILGFLRETFSPFCCFVRLVTSRRCSECDVLPPENLILDYFTLVQWISSLESHCGRHDSYTVARKVQTGGPREGALIKKRIDYRFVSMYNLSFISSLVVGLVQQYLKIHQLPPMTGVERNWYSQNRWQQMKSPQAALSFI